MRTQRIGIIMIIVVCIAIVALVFAIALTRHHYVVKIEKLTVDHIDKTNLDFRRGFDAGWASGLEHGKHTPRRDYY